MRRLLRPEVDVPMDGFRLAVDVRDRKLGRMLYEGRAHEPALAALIALTPLDGAVCVDIGANVGLHTVRMSRRVGPRGHVFAFEPAPRAFALLEKNLRRNAAGNVTARRAAAGEHAGTARLALNPRNHADNRLASAAPARWPRLDVPVVVMDECLDDVAAGRIGLVKIDVQGWECQVLRGMRRTLARNPHAVLAVEVFPPGLREAGTSGAELVTLLRELGLGGWEFGADRLAPMHEPWVYDLLDGVVDVLVSRDADLLADLLTRWRGAPIPARPLR